MVTRREFLDTLAVGAAGLAISSTAKSYGQIMGANERLNFAVIGLNSRAYAHLSSLKANQDAAHIAYVCDVESTILAKFASATSKMMGYDAATEKRIFARSSSARISIASRSPRPTIGTHPTWRSWGCRPGSMSMLRSPAAIIPA